MYFSPHERHIMRKCYGCKETKPESKFGADEKTRRRNLCRECKRIRGRASYRRNREKRLASVKAYYEANRSAKLEYAKKWHQENLDRVNVYRKKTALKLRSDVFEAYGGKCLCCGETTLLFLTIDHIDGDGNRHRKKVLGSHLKAGTHFYRWLRQNDYPSGFRILCFNCNMGRHRNGGVCPHERTVCD